MSLATGTYYADGIMTNIQIAIHNSSVGYQLPYKTRAVIDMTDLRFVVPLCLYEAMFVVTISFGYVGFDCLFTNLTMHLTSQFAILTYNVKNALNDPKGCRKGMKKLVVQHRRLIRLAEQLEDNFNIIILQQLLGTTVHLCITGYHTMVGSTKAEVMKVIAFSSYAVISMSMATGLYFVMNMLPNVQIVLAQNSSMDYRLPYKTRAIIGMEDTRIYACLCIYQLLVGPSITFGYVGFDCLFTNLALHITAQFGILSCKVKEILADPQGFQRGIWKLVFRHYQLISLAERLENDFNIVILQQLLGTTFHLCISGYHALTGSINGQGIKLLTFFLYGFCVISTLFFYCYIGECLIQESTKLGNAFYHYEWYDVSPVEMKQVYICMLRTKKPQQLTSGKFCVLSLATFTDILKASMGYLSGVKKLVLRHRRLIRLAEALEDNFNIVILQQLLGTTVHLCISGYHALVGTTTGQSITLITFMSYGFCVVSTLFVYCYIGECLIQESTNFGNALYEYEWYNISPVDSKMIHICMMRTKKPSHLTSDT
ncbi:hypothetical protein KPH14_002617 [Odynerus spinipes]|uniref:Odorant receptor n=1 Tax=Odynerus spinipes TaxID=1348599 RepID=A0AAD9R840_9HYME|nr:hypothetical protein KPH14_002617 [Odynerus spinipes]